MLASLSAQEWAGTLGWHPGLAVVSLLCLPALPPAWQPVLSLLLEPDTALTEIPAQVSYLPACCTLRLGRWPRYFISWLSYIHSHELSTAQARRAGAPWLCSIGSAQHWPSAPLWGSLSTLQTKGCHVLRCWKSSRALSCDAHGVSPLGSYSPAAPSDIAPCWQPQDCSSTGEERNFSVF